MATLRQQFDLPRPPPPRPVPPASAAPLVSEAVVDAPTQRLYLTSAFLLLQSFKAADFLLPSKEPPPLAELLELNWCLWKWVAVDLAFLFVAGSLRVPRFDWGWRGRLVLSALLVFTDWFAFGHWKFTASMLLPAFIKSLLATYLSTTERSVRLSSVVGDENAHLGGQFTVHILAVSTAQLNPASTSFCLPVNSRPESIRIPLVLNNTTPSRLTYSVTPLGGDASSAKVVSVSASSLLHPPSEKTPENLLDDIEEWAFGPQDSAPASLHHQLLPASSSRDDGDPLHLSPSQSLYYLPVTTTGIVRLISVLDTDGIPVRIRRVLASREVGDARVLSCPRGGFATTEEKVHLCLSPSSAGESRSLDLQVAGWQPLSVKWHTAGQKADVLEGITSTRPGTGEDVINVPQNISLTAPGSQTFILDSVSDGAGNVAYFEGDLKTVLEGTRAERIFVAHQLPEVAFSGVCGRGEDVKLLQNKTATLELKLSAIERAHERKDSEWTLRIKFTPQDGGPTWEREKVVTMTSVRLEVDQPGTYEVRGVKNRWCEGVVLVPSTCTVVIQPLPTVEVSFSPLVDVCGSEVGALATLLLTGTPPFVVSYIATLPSSFASRRAPLQFSKQFTHSRATLRLEPEPGEWEYRFTGVQDAYYPNVQLPRDDNYVRKQTVQPTSGAEWKGKERMVKSCDGSTVSVEVSLKGSAPWEMEYAVVGSPPQLIRDIQTPDFSFEIPIPPSTAQRGGEFSLSLVSVKDSNGCRRPLSNDDLIIDVRRTKPTARFHGAEGVRKVVIRENDSARIPLRLTGEGPWTVSYLTPSPPSNPNARPRIVEFKATQPNADVEISNAVPGVYTLVSVRDRHCPGDVSEPDWTISTIPRPTLKLAADTGELARDGSLVRAGVCENAEDHVTVLFEGKAPFKATYYLTKGPRDSEKRVLQTIQPRADLTLFTGSAGRHVYELAGVADAYYSASNSAGVIAPVGGRAGLIRVIQDVFPLPSAAFKPQPAAKGFCVNDQLASRGIDDLVLRLEGHPPFKVEMEVREEGHRAAQHFTVEDIRQHDWPVELPFALTRPAPHLVAVRKVTDARGCERAIDGETTEVSTVVGVAEIATIAPVLPQTNHCVGDMLDFKIEGAPPFTVTYEFNSHIHVVSDVQSRFSRLAAAPGVFKILSVGHGQDQCRSSDVALAKRVFALPTAKVHHGEDIFVDLREGDQTEIFFEFTGEPPFTFTYARRHPQDRSKDRTVLETHTVTGIMERSYSIFTSQEGTWSVSAVSDAHCSFPSSTQARLEK